METGVGQLVAYGFNVVTNEGASPVTNISARLVPSGDGSSDGILAPAPCTPRTSSGSSG